MGALTLALTGEAAQRWMMWVYQRKQQSLGRVRQKQTARSSPIRLGPFYSVSIYVALQLKDSESRRRAVRGMERGKVWEGQGEKCREEFGGNVLVLEINRRAEKRKKKRVSWEETVTTYIVTVQNTSVILYQPGRLRCKSRSSKTSLWVFPHHTPSSGGSCTLSNSQSFATHHGIFNPS